MRSKREKKCVCVSVCDKNCDVKLLIEWRVNNISMEFHIIIITADIKSDRLSDPIRSSIQCGCHWSIPLNFCDVLFFLRSVARVVFVSHWNPFEMNVNSIKSTYALWSSPSILWPFIERLNDWTTDYCCEFIQKKPQFFHISQKPTEIEWLNDGEINSDACCVLENTYIIIIRGISLDGIDWGRFSMEFTFYW